MRYLEIISIFLAFVVIINLSMKKSFRRETLLLIFINIICTILHLIIEGYRWQMIPLYVLLGLFVLIKNKEFYLSISVVLIMTWLLAILLPFLIYNLVKASFFGRLCTCHFIFNTVMHLCN